jgi:hypothetical protein
MAFAAVSAGLLFFTVALIFAIDADPSVERRPHLGIPAGQHQVEITLSLSQATAEPRLCKPGG